MGRVKSTDEIDWLKEEEKLVDRIMSGEEKEISLHRSREVIEIRMDIPEFSNEDAWFCIKQELEEKRLEEEAEKRAEERKQEMELQKEFECFIEDLMDLRNLTEEEAREIVTGCPRGYLSMFYNMMEAYPNISSWKDIVDSSMGLLD